MMNLELFSSTLKGFDLDALGATFNDCLDRALSNGNMKSPYVTHHLRMAKMTLLEFESRGKEIVDPEIPNFPLHKEMMKLLDQHLDATKGGNRK